MKVMNTLTDHNFLQSIKNLKPCFRIVLWLGLASTLMAFKTITYPSDLYYQELLTIKMENSTVAEVFSEIERKTEYKLLYHLDFINLKRKISVFSENGSIESVLKQIFKNTNVGYVIYNDQIVLRRNKVVPKELPEAKLTSIQEISEDGLQRKITGYVYDVSGFPLPGVSILIEGTQRGVASNFDGFYKIEVKKNEVLVFSYLGFLTKKIVVKDQVNLEVVMEATSFELEAVELVSTGYKTLPKDRATGSFATIKQDVVETKINQDIFSKLAGEASGLLSGEGTGETGFIIRGISSLNAGTNQDPLIVVDGIPLEGSFNTINPNDVKNVTILKDAAAASIWGVRAANGVIVITTKKGNNNQKLEVSLSTNLAITSEPDLFAASLGDASLQIEYQRELVERGFFRDANFIGSNEVNILNLRSLPPVVALLLAEQRGDISTTEVAAQLAEFETRDLRREYSNLVLRPRIWNQYNLAVSAGGEEHSFRASLSYNNNQNELIETGSDQIIANFSNSLNFSDKLNFNTVVNISRFNEELQPNESSDLFSPGFGNFSRTNFTELLNNYSVISRILDNQGNFVPSQLGANQIASDQLRARGFAYDWTHNILQEFENANNNRDDTAIRIQTGFTYNFLKGLSFDLRYQYEWENRQLRNYYNTDTYAVRTRVNSFTQLDNNNFAESFPIPQGGILDTRNDQEVNQTIRAQINYDASFNDGKHKINAIAGYEARKLILETDNNRLYGYDDENLTSLSPDFTTQFVTEFSLPTESFGTDLIPPNNRTFFQENRFLSYYFNGAYTFKDTYTLSASARLDDTNLFARDNRLKNVPLYSFGSKWNITNDFFKESNVLTRLELRTTFGINGNVNDVSVPVLTAQIGRGRIPFNNIAAFVASFPNPDLRLERTKILNVGLDFRLFENLVNGSLEYYLSNSEDLISPTQLNPTLGIDNLSINNGALRNQGVDVNLTINPVRTDNFRYTTTGIFSFNKSEITRVDVESTLEERVGGNGAFILGRPLNTVFAYQFAGLDNTGAPQFFDETGNIVNARANIEDLDALVEVGTRTPVYFGSWINEFSYKSLSLRILATFRAGHIFNNRLNLFRPVPLARANVPQNFANRWQNPGDENFTRVPALRSFQELSAPGYFNYQDSDEFYDSADVFRLSQVNLNYSFPKSITDRLDINAFSMGLQADNIAFWAANKWGVDPDSILFPLRPTISLNLSINF